MRPRRVPSRGRCRKWSGQCFPRRTSSQPGKARIPPPSRSRSLGSRCRNRAVRRRPSRCWERTSLRGRGWASCGWRDCKSPAARQCTGSRRRGRSLMNTRPQDRPALGSTTIPVDKTIPHRMSPSLSKLQWCNRNRQDKRGIRQPRRGPSGSTTCQRHRLWHSRCPPDSGTRRRTATWSSRWCPACVEAVGSRGGNECDPRAAPCAQSRRAGHVKHSPCAVRFVQSW